MGAERRAGATHGESWNSREHHGTRLGMVDRAALQIATVRDPHHHRAREGVAGAPPQSGELVAELMVGGPDVVEELDLHHGLQAASREADGAAHDVRLGERGIVNRSLPNCRWSPHVTLK